MKHFPGRISAFALSHLLKKPATIAYPFGELEVDPRYRGRIVYDPTNCLGCNLCEKDCPAGAIKIVNLAEPPEKNMECHLNYAHCIFCAQCVDSCPKKCLRVTPHIELAGLDKKDMLVKM